jgi:predicted amidohydrolase
MKRIQISLIQMDIELGNKRKNLEKTNKLLKKTITQANPKLPHIVCLPELFSTGYDLENISDNAEPIPEGETTKLLQNLSMQYSVNVIASHIEKFNSNFYNTAVIIDKEGKFLGKYRKIHLFPLAPLDETTKLTSGNISPTTFRLDGVNIGVLICFDLRFPEISRRLTVNGAEVLIYLAEFPRPRNEIWTRLLQARAMENQLFVCGVNRVGKDPTNASFFGRSVVYDPLGGKLIEGSENEEILTLQLDTTIIRETRNTLPSLKYRQPSFY